ncbi:hypothetical protein DPEC_G00339720 [Dallia pectoralis]|uniref:Uncharacterized protein n=1 Tax=Dallia pectoralis TaxID=75939 RepID=A0ACC2F4W0_DALPE|nr:hypothetical protein DPEC_G00339720 [Dallia pectoralis]
MRLAVVRCGPPDLQLRDLPARSASGRRASGSTSTGQSLNNSRDLVELGLRMRTRQGGTTTFTPVRCSVRKSCAKLAATLYIASRALCGGRRCFRAASILNGGAFSPALCSSGNEWTGDGPTGQLIRACNQPPPNPPRLPMG